MSIGVASTLRFVEAVFLFVADLFWSLAEVAEHLGDPELSTHAAVIVALLLYSRQYVKALIAFVVLAS